jgi:hypothetical protein
VPVFSGFFFVFVFRRYCIQAGACPLGAKSKTKIQKIYATTSMPTTHWKNVVFFSSANAQCAIKP